MRVLDIVPGTSVDGPGLRTSIYFAGCSHRCPGCHNPQSWAFDGGKEMSVGEIVEEVERHGFNVTFTGGDPLYQLLTSSQLLRLAEELKARGYTIWCYTGFEYEQLPDHPEMLPLLPYLEVLVDGPYIARLRDISLPFRGSSNQRLIDIPATLSTQTLTLWKAPWL